VCVLCVGEVSGGAVSKSSTSILSHIENSSARIQTPTLVDGLALPPPTLTLPSPPDSTLSFPVIARGHQTELSEPPIAVL
jgi:hypothetical protein